MALLEAFESGRRLRPCLNSPISGFMVYFTYCYWVGRPRTHRWSGRTGESITNPWTNETSIINFVDPQRSFTQQGLDNPESIIFHTNRREDEWHIPECKAFSPGHR